MKSRYPNRAGHGVAGSGIPYEELLYDLPDPLCLLDENGSFAFINLSFQQRTGYEAADIIGRSCFDVFIKDDHSSLEKGFRRSDVQNCSVALQGRIQGKNGCIIP